MKPLTIFAIVALISLLLALLVSCAFAGEFHDYKEWAYANGYGVIYRVNSTGYGYEPDGGMEWFSYTTKEALLAKWKNRRAPIGIYAYYMEHKDQQGYRDNGMMLFIE